jgi:hydrogenase maturation protein HypF
MMLPYTPLHHLLMRELNFAVVATSGNLTDEPICIEEQEALSRLGGIADLFLVHNRPIATPLDDSVVREVAGRELVLRSARGYAPLSLRLRRPGPNLLAVGSYFKNTVAVSSGCNVVVSQHIGDLGSAQAQDSFRMTISTLERIHGFEPEAVVCDLHPDYASTQFARASGKPIIEVQHHYAHVLSCMAENGLEAPVFGIAWDGTGLGTDGTIWGGEFLKISATSFERTGHFRTFRLPGGDKAAREPRRSGISLLYEIFGAGVLESSDLAPVAAFSKSELANIRIALDRGLNAPITTSVGRLFDAVASILGIRQRCTFEGQAAMQLEAALGPGQENESYPFLLTESLYEARRFVVDWMPLISSVMLDSSNGVNLAVVSARFHNALAEIVVETAKRSGIKSIVLAGGCFQNKYLTERAVLRLREEGFVPYWHGRVPPNDNGISVGQIFAAARAERE